MSTVLLRRNDASRSLQKLQAFHSSAPPLCRLGKGKKKTFVCLWVLLAEVFLDIAELPGGKERDTQRGSSPVVWNDFSTRILYCDLPVAAADSLNLSCLFVMQPRQTPKWLFKTPVEFVLFLGTESTIIQKSVDRDTIHNCQKRNAD